MAATTKKATTTKGRARTVAEGIQLRNGRYIVRVWNPGKGKQGGYDWQSLPLGSTLAQAKTLKRQLEDQKANGRRRGGGSTPVAEWAGWYDGDVWRPGLWLKVWPRPSETTNIHNDSQVRGFARKFAGRTMDSITEEEAQLFVLESPSTYKEIHTLFNDAMKSRRVVRNPFQGLRAASRDGRTDIVVLTDAELAQLVGIARVVHRGVFGGLFAAMIETAAWTGVRPGELFLFSLEPGDRVNYVDLDAGVVHVDWQLSGKTGEVKRPKNGSVRDVVLLPGAEAALRSIRSWQAGRPVFCMKRGGAMNQASHFRYWDPVRAAFVASLPVGHHLRQRTSETGGENLDFYELRHYFGTKLARPPVGVTPATPYEIAAMLGHKDGGKLAMRCYIHVGSQEAQDSIRSAWRKAS